MPIDPLEAISPDAWASFAAAALASIILAQPMPSSSNSEAYRLRHEEAAAEAARYADALSNQWVKRFIYIPGQKEKP